MSEFSFRKYQPVSLRLWHWSNALVILGLLGTVLMRKTFLSWRTNAAVIEEKLKAAGTVIPPELSKEIAVAIRNPLWDWHIYLGFGLGALFLGRVFIALFVEKEFPGTQALRLALGLRKSPAHEKIQAFHHAAVKAGYAAFYLVTALMVMTGFLLAFKTELGLPKDLIGPAKETHELLMWFFVVFIGGHLLGVVVAENREDSGLVSDMIHGGKLKADEPGRKNRV